MAGAWRVGFEDAIGRSGQVKVEDRSVADFGFGAEMAVVALDNAKSRGEAEAAAAVFGGEVWIENFGEEIGRDARALIAHANANVVARRQGSFGAGNEFVILRFDTNQTALRHGLHRVQHKVVNDLMNLAGINVGGREIGGEIEFGAHLGPAQRKVGGIADEFDERGGLANGRAAFGKGQKLLRQIAGAQSGFLDEIESGDDFAGQLGRVFDEGKIANNGGKNVVEIVGDAAGQKADRFDAGGFGSFGFELEPVRDILEHENRTDDLALTIAHGGAAGFDQAFLFIARNQQPMIDRIVTMPGFQNARDAAGNRLAGFGVNAFENVGDRFAFWLRRDPSRSVPRPPDSSM